MRLFITGATGYVDRNVVAKALLRGHNVVGLALIASNARLGLDSAVRQSLKTVEAVPRGRGIDE
jgi:nucleoside-diphosphate-sugar epimerase